MPRKIAAGNWKMNGLQSTLSELRTLEDKHGDADIAILICPPATLISACEDTPLILAAKIATQANSGRILAT